MIMAEKLCFQVATSNIAYGKWILDNLLRCGIRSIIDRRSCPGSAATRVQLCTQIDSLILVRVLCGLNWSPLAVDRVSYYAKLHLLSIDVMHRSCEQSKLLGLY